MFRLDTPPGAALGAAKTGRQQQQRGGDNDPAATSMAFRKTTHFGSWQTFANLSSRAWVYKRQSMAKRGIRYAPQCQRVARHRKNLVISAAG